MFELVDVREKGKWNVRGDVGSIKMKGKQGGVFRCSRNSATAWTRGGANDSHHPS